jgi:hypothetical protein
VSESGTGEFEMSKARRTSITKAYLKSRLNTRAKECFDWKNWVRSIQDDFYQSGCKQFEISGRYTASGNPEVMFYDILPSTRK